MIVLVSSSAGERAALGSLCEHRGWVVVASESLLAARRILARNQPRVVVMRHVLKDGYSDQLLSELSGLGDAAPPRTIVLCAAGTSASAEARQLQIGADCVLRDPVRIEVLVAYVAKYWTTPPRRSSSRRASMRNPILSFAGATLHLTDRTLRLRRKEVNLTPREVELIDLLVRCAGQVVSYDMLYSEMLGRRFRGDTSNLRVLLGKLVASARLVGINVRDWVDVIPKGGYRYLKTPRVAIMPGNAQAARLNAR